MGNPFLTPRSTSALVNAIPDKDMPWGTRILHLVSLVFLAGEGGEGRLYFLRSLEQGLIFRAAAGNRA